MLRCVALIAVCALSLCAAEPATNPIRLGIVVDNTAFDVSKGLPIQSVVPGSTAAQLGVQVGDLLASVNGEAITSDADVLRVLGTLSVGAAITLEVQRAGERKSLSGTVVNPPTAEALLSELGSVRGELNQVKAAVDARTREPTLAELLRELQVLQEQFPRAAAEFKKLYPKGEFSIVIRITSDATATEPIDLMNLPNPSAVVPPALPVEAKP